MDCRGIDLHNPYLWIILIGLFLGITIAQASYNPRKALCPERARTWKWVLVSVFASFFLALGFISLFMVPPASLIRGDVLFFGGGAVAVFGLAFRFKRAVGFPVLVLICGFVLYTSLVLMPFGCVSGSRRIGWITMLSQEGGKTLLKYASEGEPVLIEQDTHEISVTAAVISMEPWYLLRGRKSYYMLLSYPGSDKTPDEPSASARGTVLERGRKLATRLPGSVYREETAGVAAPERFITYVIYLDDKNGLMIRPEYYEPDE